MSARFPSVSAPIMLGFVELRNRFVMTAHVTGTGADHMPQDQLQAYYRERAAGGVAMIVSEAASVHPTATHMGNAITVWDDRIVEHYRGLTDDLHHLGCRFVVQLWHCGNNTHGMATGRPVWSASEAADVMHHEIAHAVTVEEIDELVAAYGQAAQNAVRGGADGVEIHMGHGYLPQQFMSPMTNARRDDYGGSFENRLRFPLNLLAAVRDAIGGSAILGVRLSVDEGVRGGLGVTEMQEIARALTRGDLVSYVSASFGTYGNMEVQVAPMGRPAGHLAHLACAVRAVVDVPVVAVGRILTPALAEELVARGKADLIGMARELIADPDYVAKALDGVEDQIRPCIGCNYCQSRLWYGTYISCIHNPAAGRELELGRVGTRLATAARRVLVVGGGPAGLEAARTASSRGHDVTLIERSDALGGQLLLAARVVARREILGVVEHLLRELERHDVTVEVGREVTAEDVVTFDPDVVVVATGSVAFARSVTSSRVDAPSVSGLEDAGAISGRDALGDPERLANPVVVFDLEGHVQGLSVTEHLLDSGKHVTYVTSHTFPGSTVGAIAWVKLMQSVNSKGATLLYPFRLEEIDGRTSRLENVFGGESRAIEVGSLVVVGDTAADDRLALDLRTMQWPGAVFAVGDCVAPRHLDMAILEGRRAGLAL